MKRPLALISLALAILMIVAFAGCGSNQPAVTSNPVKPRPATQQAAVGDIEVAYRVYGSGYPLLMIMGYGGTQDVWDPTVIDLLSRRYKVITFDNRGMGGTTAGTKDFNIKQFADDTAGFMDAIGISRAHVLGWSMGTNIAQVLVLDYPGKVNRLMLYAADCGGPQSTKPAPATLKKLTDTSGTPVERGARLTGLLFPAGWFSQKKNADYVAQVMSGAAEPTPAESVNKQAQALDQWFQTGVYDRLSSIKSLTMLLTGTQDILTPPQNSVVMVQRIPNAWLVQFAGGGHGVQYQYPQDFAKSVLNFLSSPS
jgi:pimeloyl-ACP methyl ester carboxylesterase